MPWNDLPAAHLRSGWCYRRMAAQQVLQLFATALLPCLAHPASTLQMCNAAAPCSGNCIASRAQCARAPASPLLNFPHCQHAMPAVPTC